MLPIYTGSIFFTNKKYIFAALPERCLSEGPLWGVSEEQAWKVETT